MTQRRGYGGRPKLREADPGEKITISVRITPEMKARLEEIAATTGRSQSQEVEYRLSRSFERDELLPEVLTLAFGRQAAGLLMAFGLLMVHAGEDYHAVIDADEPWTESPGAFGNIRRGIVALLDAADPTTVGHLIGSETGGAGVNYAENLISALKSPTPTGNRRFIGNVRMIANVRNLLGPTATRMTKTLGPKRRT